MQIKLNESLREQLGGTYSPNVGGRFSACRAGVLVPSVYSSPENVEKLTKSVFPIIDSVQKYGPTPRTSTR